MSNKRTGVEAVEAKGWLRAHKWLILRRVSQLGILGVFLLGPLAGVWIVKGNLNFSYTLDFLPLTDPYVALQAAVFLWVMAKGGFYMGNGSDLAFYPMPTVAEMRRDHPSWWRSARAGGSGRR